MLGWNLGHYGFDDIIISVVSGKKEKSRRNREADTRRGNEIIN